MNSKFATLIIQHELDLGSKAILAEVAALASTQVLDSYFLIGVGASTSIETGDFDANYVTSAGSERCKLLDRLSRVGAIDQLRIVCLNAASEESDEQISSEIAESVIRIKTSLDQLLGASVSVSEIRIGIRGYHPLIFSRWVQMQMSLSFLMTAFLTEAWQGRLIEQQTE